MGWRSRLRQQRLDRAGQLLILGIDVPDDALPVDQERRGVAVHMPGLIERATARLGPVPEGQQNRHSAIVAQLEELTVLVRSFDLGSGRPDPRSGGRLHDQLRVCLEREAQLWNQPWGGLVGLDTTLVMFVTWRLPSAGAC